MSFVYTNSNDIPELSVVESALSYISSENRDDWVKIGNILGRTYPNNSSALNLYHEWGRKASNRKRGDENKERHEFEVQSKRDGAGIGTLFQMAMARGWEHPGKSKERIEPRKLKQAKTPADSFYERHGLTVNLATLNTPSQTAPAPESATAQTAVEAARTLDQSTDAAQTAMEATQTAVEAPVQAAAAGFAEVMFQRAYEEGMKHISQSLTSVWQFIFAGMSSRGATGIGRLKGYLSEYSGKFALFSYENIVTHRALKKFLQNPDIEILEPGRFIKWALIWAKEVGFTEETADWLRDTLDSDGLEDPILDFADLKNVTDEAYDTAAAVQEIDDYYVNTGKDIVVALAGRDFKLAKEHLNVLREHSAFRARASAAEKDITVLDAADMGRMALEYRRAMGDPEKQKEYVVPSGHETIDKIGYGYFRGFPNLIVAESGLGKTWFCADAAIKILQSGGRVIMFSTELSAQDVSDRFTRLAINKGTEEMKWHDEHGELESLIAQAMDEFGDRVELVATQHGLSTDTIFARTAEFAAKGPVDLIIVDYFQDLKATPSQEKLGSPGDTRLLTEIGFELKRIAANFNAPMLIAAQMTNPNQRSMFSKREPPNMYHVANCTALTKSSALVMLLYKDVDYPNEESAPVVMSLAKVRHAEFSGKYVYTVQRQDSGSFKLKEQAGTFHLDGDSDYSGYLLKKARLATLKNARNGVLSPLAMGAGPVIKGMSTDSEVDDMELESEYDIENEAEAAMAAAAGSPKKKSSSKSGSAGKSGRAGKGQKKRGSNPGKTPEKESAS